MPAILELRHLSKQFDDNRVVNDVSLEVERGAFYALVGPSGCGKTTILRLVAGFEEAASGDIILNGARINELKPFERKVSTVFQSYALFPHMTVRENIEFGLRRKGVRNPALTKSADEAVELVRLGGKEDRYPAQLSGGEKQRVALARSLVVEPDVLLLDEPLSALDPQLRQQVRLELKALQQRVGTTFIFVTHDQEEALSLADRIAVLHKGCVEQSGTPEELYVRPRTRFVADFLGHVNWIGDVGVRPEATRVSREPAPSGFRSVRATIHSSTFLGGCFQVHATLPSGERITAELSRGEAVFTPGQLIHIWWQPGDELRTASES